MVTRILSTFNIYFLFLMLLSGFVVGFVDYNHYNKNNLIHIAKKARIIGISSLVIGVVLYLLSQFIF
ncbi:MAG: hypothetical protein Q8900_00570 [Bacillota bacterium]|nr:hypothetical protein [Bacillota bacterium]